MELLIQRALSPAKITSMNIDRETKRVAVYLKPDQVSLAIGRGGQNIKLAGRLVGFDLDVFRDIEGQEDEEDVDLSEFSDEIDNWMLEEFRRLGLDTAKQVLNMSKEELIRRTDLEEETVEEILTILKGEFE
jgi:N utilization substance protein A